MSDSYDVVVIGGGPAGYPCAIRAGQLGLSVACIDNWVNRDGGHAFGGTCLNAGCIPSKALLESSELYHRSQHEFATHGIKIGKASLDLAAMQKRKNDISSQLTGGIGTLFKANGVEGLPGTGSLAGKGKVRYQPHEGEARELTAKHIVIATGSKPVELKKIAPFDGDRVVDSWGALDFEAPYVIQDLPAGGKRLMQGASGYDYTVVSGVVTFENGEATGELPGKLVRGMRDKPAATAIAAE